MLDSICMNIPEWGNAKTDIAEIRSDIVCTLKNVETILNDLFAFHKQNESNAPLSVVLLSLPHPQSTSNQQQPIAELYRLCMNFSSSSTPDTQLYSVTSAVRGLLQQCKANSISEVAVRVGCGGES